MTEQFQMATFGAPSGATYFVNALLELGFHVYNAPFGPWFDRESSSLIKNSQQIPRSVGIPYFKASPIRPPWRKIDIAWSHQWSTPCYGHTRAIIGVRDPRQTLFSQWRRMRKQKNDASDFGLFLASPYFSLGLSPIDEWILWHALWLNRPAGERFVVRFETAKSDPISAFGPLLTWMGETGSDEAFLDAAASSSVERAREADPDGRIVFQGALRDFDADPESSNHGAFARTAIPMFETLEVPDDLRDLPLAVECLAKRFDGTGAGNLIELAAAGMFLDLRRELAHGNADSIFTQKLKNAIEIMDRLFTTPVFPFLNHQDPALRSGAAAVIGTLARSATPELGLKSARRSSRLDWILNSFGRMLRFR